MGIQQQKQFTILVVGDSCLDEYYFGTCDRLSPEAPVPIFKKVDYQSKQGMCLNVAANLRAFGNFVKVDTNKEKIKKIRLIDKKSNQHILRIDEEPKLKRIDLRKYTKDSLKGIDALVVSDYNKGYVNKGDILDIITPALILGIPIFVDSKKQDLSQFENCIIKINKLERDRVEKLPNICELIVSLGPDGCLWNNEAYPTQSVDVHDVCGAGDVFLASLVHMYMVTSGNIKKSINFANRCASRSVMNTGTYVLTKQDIVECL